VKYVTRDEAENKRLKAVQFLRDVVGDDDKAAEFDDMDTDSYAERKGLSIVNPARRNPEMAYTKAQLMERVRDLEEENEDLYDRLDGVIAAAQPEPDEDEDDEDGDDQDADDEDGDEDDDQDDEPGK
jgi:hypothetical protein